MVWRLAAAPTCCDGRSNIGYFFAEASKERLSVLFHFFRRVTPYRVLVPLHLINKAGTKPIQIAIGKVFSFCVGAFDAHLLRYDRLNE